MPIAQDDSCSAKMKDTCHRSPFGMMFVHSTDARGEAVLTWFLVGFRAKTSASPGVAPESTGSGADSGLSLLGSLARYDRASRMWKTHQLSLLADSGACLETWPRWGQMLDGVCYPQQPSALGTNGIDCGLLPTLTATEYGSNRGGAAGRMGAERPSLQTMARRGTLPTLTCGGNYNRKGASPTIGDGLATVLGGPLNPEWCEWFMGWPIGWTGSAPLVMDRFRSWLLAHGGS